jgi:hypothetical protein
MADERQLPHPIKSELIGSGSLRLSPIAHPPSFYRFILPVTTFPVIPTRESWTIITNRRLSSGPTSDTSTGKL